MLVLLFFLILFGGQNWSIRTTNKDHQCSQTNQCAIAPMVLTETVLSHQVVYYTQLRLGSRSILLGKHIYSLRTPFVFFSITFRGAQEQIKAMIDPFLRPVFDTDS
jgi:hypothetical protein